MRAPDLNGVQAKITRALAHIAELEREVTAYHGREPYVVVVEDRPETGQRVAKVGQMREPIPDVLPLQVGDAAHNLRGALDHLAYQLSPGKDTAFPVWKPTRTPTSRDLSALVSGKLRGVDPGVKEAIVAAQPYLGGAGEGLWVVDYLDNVDKHRLLLAVGAAHSSVSFDAAAMLRRAVAENPEGPFRSEDIPVMMLSLRPADRYPVTVGTELFLAPPQEFDAMAASFTLDVALGEPEAVAGEPIVPTLRHLADTVEAMVNAVASVLLR